MKTLPILMTTSLLAILAVIGYGVVKQLPLTGLAAQVFSSQTQSAFNTCIESFTTQKINTLHITPIAINTDHTTDAIVQYREGPQCGNAGCVYELCVSNDSQSYVHVPLGIAGRSIAVLDTISNGMHDLEFNQDQHQIMSWDSHAYVLNGNGN